VAISVEGTTCNDCAEKLARTLNYIPGTHDVRVNFIRGQADFGIEPSLASVDNILATAWTATGFVLNRIKQGGGEILTCLFPGLLGVLCLSPSLMGSRTLSFSTSQPSRSSTT
jgi:Cu2+-exporting ATPase